MTDEKKIELTTNSSGCPSLQMVMITPEEYEKRISTAKKEVVKEILDSLNVHIHNNLYSRQISYDVIQKRIEGLRKKWGIE